MEVFTVTETCRYSVRANNIEDAKERFLESTNVGEFPATVTERTVDGEEF